MIGSPAARDWTDSTGVSVRLFFAAARSPATINTAKPAMTRWAGRNAPCLGFGFTQRDVMCRDPLRLCRDPLGLRELTAKWWKKDQQSAAIMRRRTFRHSPDVPCVDGSGLARRIFTLQ